MEWIFKMIEPVIKDCNTPEESEAAVIAWGKGVEPRDAALGLIAVRYMNEHYFKALENKEGLAIDRTKI